MNPTDFIRIRKMTFPMMIIFKLSSTKKSLQSEQFAFTSNTKCNLLWHVYKASVLESKKENQSLGFVCVV